MFTGLICTVGTLQSFSDGVVQINWEGAPPPAITQDLAIGDSIAVDGICLSVTQILPIGFRAAVSPETLSRTTLSAQTSELRVNLEPSLRVGSKLGGHFVTGHIDGIGYLETSVQTAQAWEMSFQVPDARVARYIVPKGSIAVNGVSLTVADCDRRGAWFKVAVIPITYAETNLRHLQPGSPVNLEGDVLGKYVEKFLNMSSRSPDSIEAIDSSSAHPAPATADLDLAFLAEHGYH